MKIKGMLFGLLVTLTTGTSVLAAAPEPETYAFQYKLHDNLCRIDYPRADGLTLSWMVTKPTGVFMIAVTKDRWDIVDGQDLNAQNKTATVEFEGVGTSQAQLAGYFNEGVQGFWAMWTDTTFQEGQSASTMLLEATAVKITYEGKYVGRFDMKNKAFTYNLLKNCLTPKP